MPHIFGISKFQNMCLYIVNQSWNIDLCHHKFYFTIINNKVNNTFLIIQDWNIGDFSLINIINKIISLIIFIYLFILTMWARYHT